MTGDAVVTLAHGGGGRLQRDLLEHVIQPALANPWLDPLEDAARVAVDRGDLAFTTDAFVVRPLFFPGGDIGALAVNGTVNDLAVSGAVPRWISLALVLEEGLPLAILSRVLASIAGAARAAEVVVVTGDTKVVERGQGGGSMILCTAGVGLLSRGAPPGAASCRPGDQVVVSGPIGDHGAAIFAAREELGGLGGVASDCAPVTALCQTACGALAPRFMRDPTRGGLLAVSHELAAAARMTVELDEAAIPVRRETRALAEILGIDPWRLASEGRVVAVTPEGSGPGLAELWRTRPDGAGAAVIGRLREAVPGAPVVLNTTAGGRRPLDLPPDDPLPRIC